MSQAGPMTKREVEKCLISDVHHVTWGPVETTGHVMLHEVVALNDYRHFDGWGITMTALTVSSSLLWGLVDCVFSTARRIHEGDEVGV